MSDLTKDGAEPAGFAVDTATDTGALAQRILAMPLWQCHRQVRALRITSVVDGTKPDDKSDDSRVLSFVDAGQPPLRVDHAYMLKHRPAAGGYFVVYDDGYQSYSPAAAFEAGYTPVIKAAGNSAVAHGLRCRECSGLLTDADVALRGRLCRACAERATGALIKPGPQKTAF